MLDWLAYHKWLGFTDFLVYSNDCEDGTDALLDRLQALGALTHVPQTDIKRSPQWSALKQAESHPLVQTSDWVMVSDVDEYPVIHAGAGRLRDLWDAAPQADGFLLGWRMFGAADAALADGRPLPQLCTHCAPDNLLWPWRAVQFKSLFRNNGHYAKLGVHMPRKPLGENAFRWVDDSGRSHTQPPKGGFVGTTEPRYTLAQLNHYALATRGDYLVKRARGKANHVQQGYDAAYWQEMNWREVADETILPRFEKALEIKRKLLEDAQIAALHERGIVWRREKAAELAETADGAALMAEIDALPPTVAPSMAQQVEAFRAAAKKARNAET